MPHSVPVRPAVRFSRKKFRACRNAVGSGHDAITSGDQSKWIARGEGRVCLLGEMKAMYWQGVRHDLEAILWTLKNWQKSNVVYETLDEEEDLFVHGFDTFIDQVSQQSRAFANRNRKSFNAELETAEPKPKTHKEAIYERALEVLADQESCRIKGQVRELLESRNSEPILQQRTRMLLQAAGFLDVDKLIEHREPLQDYRFWKRPGMPQLCLDRFTEHGTPILSYLRCAESECKSTIRGSFFIDVDEPSCQICESCYRKSYYNSDRFEKKYKHCILDKSISSEESRRICRCATVKQLDKNGRRRALYPIDEKVDKHHGTREKGRLQCGLLKLGDRVAITKCEEIRNPSWASRKGTRAKEVSGKNMSNGGRLTQIVGKSLQSPTAKSLSHATTTVISEYEDSAEADVPFFLRNYTAQYPFGNVHMALRFGPLVIENEVEQ